MPASAKPSTRILPGAFERKFRGREACDIACVCRPRPARHTSFNAPAINAGSATLVRAHHQNLGRKLHKPPGLPPMSSSLFYHPVLIMTSSSGGA